LHRGWRTPDPSPERGEAGELRKDTKMGTPYDPMNAGLLLERIRSRSPIRHSVHS
jgi:hypothetical protein